MHTLQPILEQMPLFKGMKTEHIALVAGCAANVRFEPGHFIGRRGAPADRFWIIREGIVALEIHEPDRGAAVLMTLGPGDVVGWGWILPPYVFHYDIRAQGPVRALSLDGKCLRDKFASDHELGYELVTRFSRVVVRRLEAVSLQLLDVYGDRHVDVP